MRMVRHHNGVLRLLSAALIFTSACVSSAFANPVPTGYTCSGSCGTLGANGVVPLSPLNNSTYLYVTTAASSSTAVIPVGPHGGETNGSTLATPVFVATASTSLNFYFDFTTSDGSGFSDYAWLSSSVLREPPFRCYLTHAPNLRAASCQPRAWQPPWPPLIPRPCPSWRI